MYVHVPCMPEGTRQGHTGPVVHVRLCRIRNALSHLSGALTLAKASAWSARRSAAAAASAPWAWACVALDGAAACSCLSCCSESCSCCSMATCGHVRPPSRAASGRSAHAHATRPSWMRGACPAENAPQHCTLHDVDPTGRPACRLVNVTRMRYAHRDMGSAPTGDSPNPNPHAASTDWSCPSESPLPSNPKP